MSPSAQTEILIHGIDSCVKTMLDPRFSRCSIKRMQIESLKVLRFDRDGELHQAAQINGITQSAVSQQVDLWKSSLIPC